MFGVLWRIRHIILIRQMPDRYRDLDLLLRTQGWRDFAWKYDTTYFPPENGFTVSGRLRKYSLNKPIENSRVSIGIFGNDSSFLSTVPVDSTGRFKLSGIDFTGEARLIVTGIGKKDRLQGMMHIRFSNLYTSKSD